MLRRQAYSMAVDIWALGVIVYVLLCGCLPFNDDGAKIANEKAARVQFLSSKHMSKRTTSHFLLLFFRFAAKIWFAFPAMGKRLV